MKKISASFFKYTLLPSLYKAKVRGVDIKNKQQLVAHFGKSKETSAENYWCCMASEKDITDTAELVTLMKDSQHDVLAEIGIKEKEILEIDGKFVSEKALKTAVAKLEKESDSVAVKALAKVYSKQIDETKEVIGKYLTNTLSLPETAKLTDSEVKKIAKSAVTLVKSEFEVSDRIAKESVVDFLDAMVLSDLDYEGELEPETVFADLYYKNKGDELDDIELNAETSEQELSLAKRELFKYL